MSQKKIVSYALLSALLALPANALASGHGLPWEEKFTQLAESFTGPVANAAGVMGIVGLGLGFLWGTEMGHAARRAVWVVAGLCITFSSTTFFKTWFGMGTGINF